MVTTAYSWYDSYSTSISVNRGWGTKAEVQLSKREFHTKGVNFVAEFVPVWLVERNILISVSTGVPFQNYCYYIYIYI